MNAFFKKIVAAAILAGVSSVSLAYGEPPLGWTLNATYSTSNVKVYQKIGSQTYAQVVDMVGGAKVELKQLYVQQVQSTNGSFYKGYSTKSVANWYSLSGNPVSVVNGDYFGTNTVPASSLAMLSFGVRANGSLVDPGSAPLNDKQIEFFTGQGASITGANATRLANGPAQSIIGGYSPANAISKTVSLGRTGLCILSPTTPSRLFLIISAQAATQGQIDQDFVGWNCIFGNQIMMDGSASAQLSMKNGFNLTGINGDGQIGRTVPQVIVIRNN
jgi:hypothetical protein